MTGTSHSEIALRAALTRPLRASARARNRRAARREGGRLPLLLLAAALLAALLLAPRFGAL
jgi:hypothetical protein